MRHRRFSILLVLLVLLVVVHPVALQAGPAYHVLRVLDSAVFVATLWNVFRTPRSLAVALLLGLPALILYWICDTTAAVSQTVLTLLANLLISLFLGSSVVMILRAVYQENHLSREAIYGALCGFLLIGAAFSHLFTCADQLAPADFKEPAQASVQLSDYHGRQVLFMYFSYAALTGRGDPDLAPNSAWGRSLAMLESLFGQFYLLVVLAELISLRVSRTARPSNES